MYVYVSSQDSVKLYPDNTAKEFLHEIVQPIYLDGKWSCALVDTNIWQLSGDGIIVCCDVVQNSSVHGKNISILNIISESGPIVNPYYIPVTRNDISRIRISLLNTAGDPCTDQNISSSRFVLHFKKTSNKT